MRSQCDWLLEMLRSGPVCPSDWRNEMPRMAARIGDLRDRGQWVATRRCSRPTHAHRSARQVEYVLQPVETLF